MGPKHWRKKLASRQIYKDIKATSLSKKQSNSAVFSDFSKCLPQTLLPNFLTGYDQNNVCTSHSLGNCGKILKWPSFFYFSWLVKFDNPI